MERTQLERKAQLLGVECAASSRRVAIVRAIQRRLGEPECFATDQRLSCPPNSDCSWRSDCLRPIAEWLR